MHTTRMHRLPAEPTPCCRNSFTRCQEGYQHLVRSGLVGGKALLLGWNGEDTDGFLAVCNVFRRASYTTK